MNAAALIAVANGFAAAAPLLAQLKEWAAEGLSDAEIQERIADPSGVGRDLIARALEREKRGRDLLGREPNQPA